MATIIYKRIMACTGVVPGFDGKRQIKRQREIGIVLKHKAGENEWLELRLHADILNPVLFQQVKGNAIPQGDSMFIARLADVPRQVREQTVGEEVEMPAEEAVESGEQ